MPPKERVQRSTVVPQLKVPTIRDVAEQAGVSIGTASKALNNQGQLRQVTRERVRSAAERLGFTPNYLAQSLIRSRSFTVGLISTDNYGRFSIPLLEGIEHALDAADISVFLCNAADSPSRERWHIESLLAKRVDGIIVTSSRTDPRPPIDVRTSRIPVIYAYTQSTSPDALCFLPDDEHGGRLAIEQLVKAGRTSIAHITGPKDHDAVLHRLEAARRTLKANALDLPAPRILFGAWSEAWGRAAASALLEMDKSIDAIFCGSDEIAWGVTNTLHALGVRIPDDIAIVGYDNWEVIAKGIDPPLTTIDMNLHELGRQAGNAFMGFIGGQVNSGLIRLPCKLVERESCGLHSGAKHSSVPYTMT